MLYDSVQTNGVLTLSANYFRFVGRNGFHLEDGRTPGISDVMMQPAQTKDMTFTTFSPSISIYSILQATIIDISRFGSKVI